MKFTPTPKRNIIQLKSDIHIHTRKLRLTQLFHNTPETNFSNNNFTTKSNFTPPRNKKKGFGSSDDILNNPNLEGMETYFRNNLSQIEQ